MTNKKALIYGEKLTVEGVFSKNTKNGQEYLFTIVFQ